MENKIVLKITEFLKSYKKKTICPEEMSSLFGGDISYGEFADAVLELAASNVLVPVKSSGFSSGTPRLFCKYKINIGIIREEYKCEIERTELTLHKKINLDYYFTCPQSVWDGDRENILKLDSYLKSFGLPEAFAEAPERSYQIFGDEKFLDEKHGKTLLQRVRLYDEMKISPGCDPAMFFVNSERLAEKPGMHEHLIIENRTTFYALAEVLRGSALTSLIYGAGFKILSSIALFEKQIDLSGATHRYFYFGDLDYSGISIWSGVADRVGAVPAEAFYNAMLLYEPAFGKEYQRPDESALCKFLTYFDLRERDIIRSALENGQYYPQETLSKAELQRIFLNAMGGRV